MSHPSEPGNGDQSHPSEPGNGDQNEPDTSRPPAIRPAVEPAAGQNKPVPVAARVRAALRQRATQAHTAKKNWPFFALGAGLVLWILGLVMPDGVASSLSCLSQLLMVAAAVVLLLPLVRRGRGTQPQVVNPRRLSLGLQARATERQRQVAADVEGLDDGLWLLQQGLATRAARLLAPALWHQKQVVPVGMLLRSLSGLSDEAKGAVRATSPDGEWLYLLFDRGGKPVALVIDIGQDRPEAVIRFGRDVAAMVFEQIESQRRDRGVTVPLAPCLLGLVERYKEPEHRYNGGPRRLRRSDSSAQRFNGGPSRIAGHARPGSR